MGIRLVLLVSILSTDQGYLVSATPTHATSGPIQGSRYGQGGLDIYGAYDAVKYRHYGRPHDKTVDVVAGRTVVAVAVLNASEAAQHCHARRHAVEGVGLACRSKVKTDRASRPSPPGPYWRSGTNPTLEERVSVHSNFGHTAIIATTS